MCYIIIDAIRRECFLSCLVTVDTKRRFSLHKLPIHQLSKTSATSGEGGHLYVSRYIEYDSVVIATTRVAAGHTWKQE